MTDPHEEASAISRSGSKGRRIAFTVTALVLAAGALGGLFGIGIVIGWTDTAEGGIHRVHDIGFGVLYGLLLAAAFVALARRPERNPAAFFMVVATALAALVAVLVSTAWDYAILAVAVGVGAAILFALHPARYRLLHPAPRPSRVLTGFVVVAAIPLLWFGLSMAAKQRAGPSADPHVSMDHWVTMAAMAFGLVLVGAVAASRVEGWRLAAWCAGLGVAIYGVASIVFRQYPGTTEPYAGSVGAGWGLVAVIGGLAFIALSERESRRSPSDE
jgi:hypothetical protein